MARRWFFQANPKLYDIDGAVAALESIWWRVPQYTADVDVGHVVLFWRSGPGAGIVGAGRVLAAPQARAALDAEELPFLLSEQEGQPSTRALVSVTPVDFVPKETLVADSVLATHKIVLAPMGTVFPIEEASWLALSHFVMEPPEMSDAEVVEPAGVWNWDSRLKGVYPMPGGYSGYLDALRTVCDAVDAERPAVVDLPGMIERVLEVTPTTAGHRASFLRKVGLVVEEAGLCAVGPAARNWLDNGDPTSVAEALHARCRFVGELLELCRVPRSVNGLLQLANEQYGMGWDTTTQVTNRRGWLQSAGLLEVDSDRNLLLTESGEQLLSRLDVAPPHPPTRAAAVPASPAAPVEPAGDPSGAAPDAVVTALDALAVELREASTDSKDPDRFERVVRDAFEFLGFRAEWLGKSGRTDVLLDAQLGDESYRVTVDAKTSGSGAVGDQQVDWVTLAEHKVKHDADYSALVMPESQGGRIIDRAESNGVAVLTVAELVGLCRVHARTALGLDVYRTLFQSGGQVDMSAVDEREGEELDLLGLARAVVDAVRGNTGDFGRLTARDLVLILHSTDVGERADKDRIELVLAALANPLLGMLTGDPAGGYRVASSASTVGLRFALLGDLLG